MIIMAVHSPLGGPHLRNEPTTENYGVSTQNLEFINMDVSGGYGQISRQVWARVRMFWVSLNLHAA